MANEPRRRRPQRQPISDIERFLQEVDRLRRKAHEEAQQGAEPVLEVEPAAPPSPPPRRWQEEEVDEVVVLPDEPPPPPPPVRRRPSMARAVVPEVVPGQPAPPPPALALSARPIQVPTTTRRAPNASAQLLMQLLRSKQNIRASILVREILDPPLSRRPR